MIFSLLLAAMPVMAHTVQYETTVTPQATSYQGEKFAHQMKIQAAYILKPSLVSKSVTTEKTFCDYDDDQTPSNCAQYCETKIEFDAGQFAVQFNLLDQKEMVREVKPLTVAAVTTIAKGASPTCSPAPLQNLTAVATVMTVESHFKNGKSSAGISIGDYRVFAGDHALGFTLKPMSNEQYEAKLAVVNPSPEASWTFNETQIWGVSGHLKMKQK